MGCGASTATVAPGPKLPSDTGASKLPTESSPQSQRPPLTDLNILCFYKAPRKILIEYLDERYLAQDLFFYEALDAIKTADMGAMHDTLHMIYDNFCAEMSPNAAHVTQHHKHNFRSLLIMLQGATRKDILQVTSQIQNDTEELLQEEITSFLTTDVFSTYLNIEFPRAQQVRKRVLLVTSQLLIGQIMCRLIKELGYDAIIAVSAADALTQLLNSTFDTVLLSYDLPDKNGLNFIRDFDRFESRAQEKNEQYVRPVFVGLLSPQRENLRESLRHNGFQHFLSLPCHMNELLAVLPIQDTKISAISKYMTSMSRSPSNSKHSVASQAMDSQDTPHE